MPVPHCISGSETLRQMREEQSSPMKYDKEVSQQYKSSVQLFNDGMRSPDQRNSEPTL